MSRTAGLFAAAAFLVCSASLSAQESIRAAAPNSESRSEPKQIDIGAAEAPLSEAERIDLDKAVRKHDYAAEMAVIDQATAEHPGSFELLVMAGRLAYLEKKPKDAVDALERADKDKSLTEQDRMTLALAYEFSGRPAQSREQLLKLVKLSPGNAEYLYLLGRVDRQNQHLEEAAQDLNKAIELDPNFVRAYEELGQVEEGLGKMEEARKTYEIGATVNRRLAVHWEWSPLDLGILDLKANDFTDANKLFAEALRYNPRFAWGHYYMGRLLQREGRESESISEYKEAVVYDPRLRQAWLSLCWAFTRQGNKAEADRALAIFKKLEEQQNTAKGRKN